MGKQKINAQQSLVTFDTPDQDWIVVGSGSGIAPAFQNSWVNYDNTWSHCAFRKDAMGYVHLKGLVKSGVSATIFTLPAGYRPISADQLLIATVTNSVVGVLQIGPSGVVNMNAGNNAWFALDNVTFKAEA